MGQTWEANEVEHTFDEGRGRTMILRTPSLGNATLPPTVSSVIVSGVRSMSLP